MSTGAWEVVAQGDPADLAHLQDNVRDARIEFVPVEDGNVALRLADFAGCAVHAHVRELAEQHLAMLSGVLKVVRGSRQPLKAGAVLWRRADGLRDVFVRLEGAQVAIAGGDVGLIVRDAGGNVEPPPESPAMARTRLAMVNAAVAEGSAACSA